MPSFEEKAIFRQKQYIEEKFTRVREETQCVIRLFQTCINVFDCRVKELVNSKGDCFLTLYRKLNNEFEDFQEQLMYVQASIEVPPKCHIFSEELSLNKEESSQHDIESENLVSSSHLSSTNSLLESSSCIASGGACDLKTQSYTLIPNPEKSISSLSQTSYHDPPDFQTSQSDLNPCTLIKTQSHSLIPNLEKSISSLSQTFYHDSPELQIPQSDLNPCTLIKTQSYTILPNSEKSVSSLSQTTYHDPLDSQIPQSDLNPCAPSFYIDIDLEKSSVHSNQISTSLNSSQNISVQHSISNESLSHASCYQSFSSNVSDFQSVFSCMDDNNQGSVFIQKNDSQNFVNPESSKKTIIPLNFILPMKTTAILTYIEDPGNFWMQLESSKATVPTFPRENFYHSPCPIHVETGDFCLAPSKSVPFYLRVKVLSEIQDQQTVKVLFIDHGSCQWVPLQELRILPLEAFDIPMQVFNCYLAEISAPNNIWVFAAIRKLKEFSNNSIETHIKYQTGDKYGVQLIATISMFNEEFSCDIGQSLCYDGFALENKVFETKEFASSSALCEPDQNDSSPVNNKLSCDSGVSVTSNQRLSPSEPHRLSSSQNLSALCIDDTSSHLKKESPAVSEELELVDRNDTKSKTSDLITFESIEELPNETIENSKELMPVSDTYNKCSKTCICECPLHFIIPFPSIKFVEANMVLVMLSHIDNPNEFYVNMAMESSTSLDELLEQMTNAYNTPNLLESNYIILDDLKEGMFCAAGFEDGCWYRVKILSIHLKFDESPNVFVQYVDYGNKAWIKNSDLRTLTPEFAKHPAYSVKCSLAGVIPCSRESKDKDESQIWSKKAIETFKNMLSFENCFTAEICDRVAILNNDPLQVLLWDTQSKEDVLINKSFVDSGVAEFDLKRLQDLFNTQQKKSKDIEVLNKWNPMLDEYNSVENSYGVNLNDLEVAINGYKHNDEEYICKYFSLRGYCPRGKNCTYKHIPLAEGGVTRDLEELYAFDSHPPLPDDNSYVLVQVSAVYSPNYFYVQFPFGGVNVNDLDSRINRGAARENVLNLEIQALYEAINDHYSNKPFDERTTVALSYGTIVVALRKFDQTWHRARVIDVQDINGPAQLFYVDYGNEEWVERRNIRQIIPEFLHIPFQAVECCLYDVEPLGFEQGRQWSGNAVSCFKNLVSEIVILAHVAYRLNNVLHVSLRMTTANDHLTIKDHLIREGYGQERNLVIKKKPKTVYIPG